MLISTSIPEIEITRSKSPIALAISAGYIKPHKITARGNYFVINDKKVRGIYAITNKYKYTCGNTPCSWYSIQEANPIDPIMVDRLNKFMATNSLITLKFSDIKHGVRLRQLALQREKIDALQTLEQEEVKLGAKLGKGIDSGIEKIEKAVLDLKEQYDKSASMPEKYKAKILLDTLKNEGILDDTEYSIFLQKVDGDKLKFDGLIIALRESHIVRVVEPLDQETEKFVYALSNQNADEWAGHTQDLRNTKRGLGEMVSRQISSMLSWYLLIPPAPMIISMLHDKELHYKSTPIAIILYHNRIIMKKIQSNWYHFIIHDKKVGGIYEIDHTCQYMWGKTRCYIYNVDSEVKPDHRLLKKFKKYVNAYEMYSTMKVKGKNVAKSNEILDHLFSDKKIDESLHLDITDKINNSKIDFDDFIDVLEQKQIITVKKPLNLDVEGFIGELGAQNAQEWAGFTQDLRNDKKGLADMTSKPVKEFWKAGIILAIGLTIVIAAVMIPSNWSSITKGMSGSGNATGGFTLNPLDMFKPAKFLDILYLKTPTLFDWMINHIPWLLEWLS